MGSVSCEAKINPRGALQSQDGVSKTLEKVSTVQAFQDGANSSADRIYNLLHQMSQSKRLNLPFHICDVASEAEASTATAFASRRKRPFPGRLYRVVVSQFGMFMNP